MFKTGSSLAVIAAALVGVAPSAALAQDANDSLLGGEIIVTAQKRSQDVQDVGIAIATYSGDQLRALGVTDSTNLAALTPGVHISGNLAGQNTQLTIRGVTQNDFNDIVEAPNAAYLDETYIAVAQAQTFAVFDIDRVELLKGPQGTLFGRNATGGLVHYISRKPSFDTVEGFIDGRYSLFDSPDSPGEFRIEGAVGGPLSEKVAARAAFVWNKRDALLRNRYEAGEFGGAPGPDAGANLGDDDTLAGRFTVAFEPSETASFTLAFNGARSRVSTGPYQQKPTIGVFDYNEDSDQYELVNVIDAADDETRTSIILGSDDSYGSDVDNDGLFGDDDPDGIELYDRLGAGGDYFGYIDSDGADFTTKSDFAFKDSGKVDTWGLTLNSKFDLTDDISLTAITDYKDYKKLLFIDVDSGPANQLANYGGLDGKSYSQEIRVNGKTDTLDWVLGAYYLHIDTDSDNGLKAPVNSVAGNGLDIASDARLKTDSYSAFGQVEWKFAPKLSMIVGGRVIREEKDYYFQQGLYASPNSREVQPGDPFLVIGPIYPGGVPTAYTDKRGKTLWAGKAQLEYRPNEDLLTYIGINRGVKAGSYNAYLAGGQALEDPASVIPYKAETLVSYEGGFKYSLPDGVSRFNMAAFYYDYSDYQAYLFTGVSGIVVNADAENYGVEAEFYTSPMKGLDLSLAASWFNATVKDVPLRAEGPIVKDVRPTYAPEVQISGLARYQWDALGGKLAIASDFQYSSNYYYNLRNFDADKYDGYVAINAGVTWYSLDKAWEIGVDVKNITDKRIGIQGFDLATLCGCNEVSYKPPRAFVLRVHRNF